MLIYYYLPPRLDEPLDLEAPLDLEEELLLALLLDLPLGREDCVLGLDLVFEGLLTLGLDFVAGLVVLGRVLVFEILGLVRLLVGL